MNSRNTSCATAKFEQLNYLKLEPRRVLSVGASLSIAGALEIEIDPGGETDAALLIDGASGDFFVDFNDNGKLDVGLDFSGDVASLTSVSVRGNGLGAAGLGTFLWEGDFQAANLADSSTTPAVRIDSLQSVSMIAELDIDGSADIDVDDQVELGGVFAADKLTVTAGGDLFDAGGTSLEIRDTANLTVGRSIQLADQAGDSLVVTGTLEMATNNQGNILVGVDGATLTDATSFVSLNRVGFDSSAGGSPILAGDVCIVAESDLTLIGDNVGGRVSLESDGSIVTSNVDAAEFISQSGDRTEINGELTLETQSGNSQVVLIAQNGVSQTEVISASQLMLRGNGTFELDLDNAIVTQSPGQSPTAGLIAADVTALEFANQFDTEVAELNFAEKSQNNIDISGLTIQNQLSITTDDGTISQQSGVTIIAGATILDSGSGDICLTTSINNFESIEIREGENVDIVDFNGVSLNSITANRLNLLVGGQILLTDNINVTEQIYLSGGPVGQAAGSLQTTDLMVVSNDSVVIAQTNSISGSVAFNVSGGDLKFANSLSTQVDEIQFVSKTGTQSISGIQVANKIAIESAGDLQLNHQVTGSDVFLSAQTVTQSNLGIISANSLMLSGENVLLAENNQVGSSASSGRFAADVSDVLRYRNEFSLELAVLNCDGIVIQGVAADRVEMTIENGDLSQAANAPMVVGSFAAFDVAQGSVDLTSSNANNLNRLEVNAASSFELRDVDELRILAVDVSDKLFLETGGTQSIFGNINSANQTFLKSDAGVDQLGGRIQTLELLLEGTGDFNLGNTNLVGVPSGAAGSSFTGQIASDIQGNLNFVNQPNIQVSTLDFLHNSILAKTLTGVKASNVDLQTAGDLVTQSAGSPVVTGRANVEFTSAPGDLFWESATDNDIDVLEVSNASNVSLFDKDDLNLDSIEVVNQGTLFLEAGGAIEQLANATISATNAGFIAGGHLYLESVQFETFAAMTGGSTKINSDLDPSFNLTNPDFGVLVKNQLPLTVGVVSDPASPTESVAGIDAASGGVYLENQGDLTIDNDVRIRDVSEHISLITSEDFALNAKLLRQSNSESVDNPSGRVTLVKPPAKVFDPDFDVIGPTDDYIVSLVDRVQTGNFNFGTLLETDFTAEIVWADGLKDTYETRLVGPQAKPDGLDPFSSLTKVTPYQFDFLVFNRTLVAELTVINDSQINVFANGGDLDLNRSEPAEFVSVVVTDKAPAVMLPREPVPEADVPAAQAESITVVASDPVQQSQETPAPPSSPKETDKLSHERYLGKDIIESKDWNRYNTSQLDALRAEIENDDQFLPGLYRIKRTSEGGTETLLEFEKKLAGIDDIYRELAEDLAESQEPEDKDSGQDAAERDESEDMDAGQIELPANPKESDASNGFELEPLEAGKSSIEKPLILEDGVESIEERVVSRPIASREKIASVGGEEDYESHIEGRTYRAAFASSLLGVGAVGLSSVGLSSIGVGMISQSNRQPLTGADQDDVVMDKSEQFDRKARRKRRVQRSRKPA